MPIRDLAARNASLNNDYGATHGPNSPDSFEVALFTGDPMTDGVEIADTTDTEEFGVIPNGYARVVIDNDGPTFPPAVDAVKSSIAIQFPDALAEYPDSVTHWALIDAADSTTMWDCAALIEPYEQTTAGPGPNPVLSVFFDDSPEGLL